MSAESNLLVVPLDAIRLDGGTQIRIAVNEGVIAEYAEILAGGAHLPPLCVFEDGHDFWLADGFHRWHALKKIGRTEALCHAYRGTQRDAQLAAVRANHHHGLRRTNEDKRRAVEMLLADSEWAQNTDRWIAEMCGVSHPFVSSIRCQVVTVTTSQQGAEAEMVVRQGKDGKFYPQRGAKRQLAPEPSDGIDAALATSATYDTCLMRINDLARAGEKLATGPGDGYLTRRLADYTSCLELAADLLKEAKPHARCSACGGAGCDTCGQLGYICSPPVMISSSSSAPAA